MPSHTEGPWHPVNRGIGWEVHAGPQHPEGCWGPNKTCHAVNDDFRELFSEADARLIAASPTMFKALQRLQDQLSALREAALIANRLGDDRRQPKEYDALLSLIEPAITEARRG